MAFSVGVIGATGRGNYGHGLDKVWADVPNSRIIAVADQDEAAAARTAERLGGVRGFTDYRAMLTEMKPDLVAVAPRWLDQHHDMVAAAVESGAKGIYLEKPMCRTLREADAMVAACEKSGSKLAIAYQTRYSPGLRQAIKLINAGELGTVLEVRGRGKEDRRGGGEDLWVLGSHVMNLMQAVAGEPRWCSARVFEKGDPVSRRHVRDGAEGIGPLAGDAVHASYGFQGSTTGFFDSVRDQGGRPTRFGVTIYGSAGVIQVYHGYVPDIFWLQDSSWSPGRTNKNWVRITSAGVNEPEPLKDRSLHAGNVAACLDLIQAIEQDRQPEASIYEARTSTEMIAGVFESHRLGKPVFFPLENRENPLSLIS